VTQPRPLEATRVATPVAADTGRRFRSAATEFPHAVLSNGNYVTVVTTPAAIDRYRGRSITRDRRDATRDRAASSSTCATPERVPVVRHGPASGKEPQDYLVTLAPERVTFHRVDDSLATNLDIAVSTEETWKSGVCRSRTTAAGSARSTSRATRDRTGRAGAIWRIRLSASLFIENGYLPDRPRSGPAPARRTRRGRSVGRARAERGRPPYGALECETDRAASSAAAAVPTIRRRSTAVRFSNTAGARLIPF